MGITGLDYQTVDVKFTEGLDTKSNRKMVIPSKWTQLDNLSLSADGTLRRRDGYTALLPDQNGHGLATHNNELLTINGPTVASISTAATDQAVNATGSLGYVSVAKSEIHRSVGLQDSIDHATISGFTCYAWRDLTGAGAVNGINYSVIDETTGTKLVSGAIASVVATAMSPRVVAANGAFFIFYLSGTSLMCRVILATTPTAIGAEVALITSASLLLVNFDAIAFGTNSAMVAYGWSDGVTSVRTIQVIRTGSVPSIAAGPTNLFTVGQIASATLTGLCCASFSATNAGVFALASAAAVWAGMSAVVIDNTWAVSTAAAQQDNNATPAAACHITATLSGADLQVFWDRQGAWGTDSFNALRTTTLTSTLVATIATTTLLNSAAFSGGAAVCAGPSGPWICGKAFTSGSQVFLPVCVMENYSGLGTNTATNNTQNSFFLISGVSAGPGSAPVAIPLARALLGTYGPPAILNNAPLVSTPCSVATLSSGVFSLACGERTLLSIASGLNVSPSGLVRLTLTPNTTLAPIRAQLGESTYFAGGVPSAYNDSVVSEMGFNIHPEGISLTRVAGGGAMTAGVHQVVAVYEWIDGSGNRHQSKPCLPVATVGILLNDSLTVRIPTLLLSQKTLAPGQSGTGVTLALYMTQAAGLTFNRVTSVAAPVANDQTVAFVVVTVTASDASIAGNELLYTQPNQGGTTLPNVAPGPCNALAVIQNRLFFDRADQPGTFGWSQQHINNVGLQCNNALSATVPTTAGPIVGFASLDEKVIIFCRDKPCVMFGTGPNEAGGFSNYSDPVEIPSDVGCVEVRSILKMPQGVIFKSAKGWYLLGRDLQVRYIGGGVAAYDANSVSSAVLMRDRQECRFSSVTGTHLIYAYAVHAQDGEGQWSTATQQPAILAMSDAIWWQTLGVYVHISTAHGLNKDTPGAYVDQPGNLGARGIITTARTAFLRLGVLNGFQRVKWLYLTTTAPTKPDSTLRVDVRFDDDYQGNFGGYNFSVLLSGIAFTNGDVPYDLRHNLRHQKCKSVAFIFTETPALSTDVVLSGMQSMALQIGLKRGTNKLQAAQGV